VESAQVTALQLYLGHVDRPIMDTMAALILGGLFDRFRNLRAVSVENGHTWVRQLLRDIDHAAYFSKEASGRLRGRSPERLPSEIFRQHVYVAPFWEDDAADLLRLIGSDHVLLGSDWPHPEGQVRPIDFVDKALRAYDVPERRAVLRDNGARLLGLAT
jgi:predicted TIM-barrel fold metal-dependent hydrolase